MHQSVMALRVPGTLLCVVPHILRYCECAAEAQFRVMIECVATDVASMMVNVTEMQGEVERVSGSRLDSSNSPATGVKNALHKLVTKYAGDEVAERLLGAPAKQRRCADHLVDHVHQMLVDTVAPVFAVLFVCSLQPIKAEPCNVLGSW